MFKLKLNSDYNASSAIKKMSLQLSSAIKKMIFEPKLNYIFLPFIRKMSLGIPFIIQKKKQKKKKNELNLKYVV